MIYFIMQYSLLVWHAGMALMLGKEEGHLCDADISMLYIYGIPMSGTISLTNNNGNYLSHVIEFIALGIKTFHQCH